MRSADGARLEVSPPRPMTLRHAFWRAAGVEGSAFLVALALSLSAVVHMAYSGRSWMLYYDAETVLPALMHASTGYEHWALSAVLFLPELALYAVIAATGVTVKAALTVYAVADFVLAYAALRLAAGMAAKGSRGSRALGALLALAVIVALSAMEDSPRWDTFELVSLLSTATFYSATVLALIATTGLLAALVGTEAPRRLRVVCASAAGAIALVSTMSNPLFLGWVSVPVMASCLFLSFRRVVGWRRTFWVCAIMISSGILGLAARTPFSALISKDGPAYADPGRALATAVYYLRMAADRVSSPLGAVSMVLLAGLIIVSIVLSRRFIRTPAPQHAIVATMGWMSPLVTVCGAVALGAVGTRYLQPVFYAPAITLVLVPAIVKGRRLRIGRPAILSRRLKRVVTFVFPAVMLACCVILALPLWGATRVVDSSILCLDNWITSHKQTGAGRYWTVRGPKAYLADQSLLIQVDDKLRAYPWLVDRAELNVRRVSFLVSDADHPAPESTSGQKPKDVVMCGRYVIQDYGTPGLEVGAPSKSAVP